MTILESYIATTRFGFGALPGEIVGLSGKPKEWLKDQLFDIEQRSHITGLPSTSAILREYKKLVNHGNESDNGRKNKITFDLNRDETYLRTLAAIETKQPFFERLVRFWSNHFTVSAAKSADVRGLVGAMEREAIRPHIIGSFKDMLLAVSQHPAMLLYLDNDQSIGANSILGKKQKGELIQEFANEIAETDSRGLNSDMAMDIITTGKLGLNENLAREILELHTLGEGGGYDQNDVIALSNIITGWTIDYSSENSANGFKFVPDRHEPGSKTLLGKTYKEDGVNMGIEALNNLAKHPSTANFIAKKLIQHFITDSPKDRDIQKLAEIFQETDGDLLQVSLALLEVEGAWDKKLSKMKTPEEFIISAARITYSNNKSHRQFILVSLYDVGQLPFAATSPAGWSNISTDWIGSDAIMRRIKWAKDASRIFETNQKIEDMALHTLGPVISKQTFNAISNAANKQDALAILFASPEFQRR